MDNIAIAEAAVLVAAIVLLTANRSAEQRVADRFAPHVGEHCSRLKISLPGALTRPQR